MNPRLTASCRYRQLRCTAEKTHRSLIETRRLEAPPVRHTEDFKLLNLKHIAHALTNQWSFSALSKRSEAMIQPLCQFN